MRIRKAGKITDHLWRLGTEESCIYLLEGSNSSAIISGGMCYLIPVVLQQIKEFGIDENKIAHIIILHAHFDHIGTIPFFKRRWPRLNVYASQRGWDTIANPKAIPVINQFGGIIAKKMMGGKNDLSYMDWEWRDDVKGITISEGKSLDLGNMKIEFMETPGHTSCSISAYVPQLQALFPSDAVAIPFKDGMLVAANSNFTQYQQSLEKLDRVKVKILCADHYSHMIDEEASGYVGKSIAAARDLRNELENIYKKEGGVDQAAKAFVEDYFKKNPDYFLTQDIMFGVFRQMIKHLAEKMSAG